MKLFGASKRQKTDKYNVPDVLKEHPIFLMGTILKNARRLDMSEQNPGRKKPMPTLGIQHYAALAYLEQAEPMSQQALSKQLEMDPSDLVTVLDALERYKYIKRSTDAKDRRRYIVSITEKGDVSLSGFSIRARKFNEDFFAPLAPKERHQFNKLLLKILN